MKRLYALAALWFGTAAWICSAMAFSLRAPSVDTSWDVTKPRGQTREIDFTTSEGTWMSVDISPDGRWIVFDLLAHIYRVPVAGGQAECLTQASGIAVNFHPRYSPDGKFIAFVSDRAGQNNLWMMSADGEHPQPVFIDLESRITEPTWTPDGKAIIAVRNFPSAVGMWRRSARLWRFPLDGSEATELAGSSTAQMYWPAVSPDGRYVYFHSSTTARPQDGVQEGHHLQRLDLQNRRLEDVTEQEGGKVYRAQGALEIAPEISPDGRWLAFARRIPGGTISYRGHKFGPRTALWLRDLRLGSERLIMDPITRDMAEAHGMKSLRLLPGYSWAKDGKSLVLSQGGKLRRLHLESGKVETISFTARVRRTISEATRAQRSISDEPFEVRCTRWPASSPDGKKLAFEAVGKTWVMDLPHGAPRPLIESASAAFELMPAWSPDGRWIAFITVDDKEGGHLWKVSTSGGAPQRLTREPGEYLHPAWSPDGQSLVVTQGSGATMRGQTMVRNLWYDLVRVPASGGAPEFLVRTKRRIVKASFGPQGRIYFPEQRERGGTVFVSINPDGGDRREHLLFPYSDDVVPSPDGKWVAFKEGENVYLTPFDRDGASGPALIDKRDGKSAVKRLSFEGGLYPRWRNASTLEFVSGNRYFAYDAAAGRMDSVTIPLRVPRHIPQGTMALTGARIITLDNRQVIENGALIIKGSRIACVGDCRTAGADQVINVRGKTIIPGFIDVHAHYQSEHEGIIPQHSSRSAIYLAYGVTTTLDPAPLSQNSFPISELIDAGKVTGPRTFNTGEAQRAWGDVDEYVSYERVEQNVHRLAAWGAVSLKDYLQPRRDQRQWLAEAARKKRLTLTAEGADLVYNLSLVMDGHTGWEHPLMYVPLYSDAAKFLGQAKAVYSPTLLVGSNSAWALEYFLARSDPWQDPKQRRFVPWYELMRTRNYTQRPLSEYSFPIIAEGVADTIHQGGYAAIGAHGEQDGIGSHWELWVYASALKPMEALEVASLGGAYFLGLDHDLGSIKVGKLADLMILNANPLENIRSTSDIKYVMKGGRLYDADTLDEIWPEKKPFGPYPWINPDALKMDDRPENYWDRR